MEARCKILLYFDRARVLEDMKIECTKFLKQLVEKPTHKFMPLRYLLELDVMKLLDEFPELGTLLLEEPLVWQNGASDILFSCLQSMIKDCDIQLHPAQAAVTLRLVCLPKLFCPPNQHNYNGLVSFEGILLTITKPSHYVYHSVWSCPEECDGCEEILHNIPRTPPKCHVCRSVLFENSGMRRCGEKVNITFSLKNDSLPRSFTIVDDLIPKLREGTRYILAGVVFKKSTMIWQVEEIKSVAAPLTAPVPNDIEELFKACHRNPWKFICCLASSLDVNVGPFYCFTHLKICLLLSLASIKANIMTGSSILHVMSIGRDTSYVADIMSKAANMAERNVILGTSNTTVSMALIASSGGVCVMALPFNTYKQKQASAILSAIECDEIVTENSRLKLQSAVWAQGMDFRKIDAASVFGFVCRGDCGEYEEDIANFILENAVKPQGNSEEKALKCVSQYIDLVAGLKVSLDDDTENLLRSYFLVARRERSNGLSVGSMGALIAATQTSARLCRRSIAKVEDAVFAIWLHISGSPEPRLAPEEYLQTSPDIGKWHKTMNDFKEWLEQFIGITIDLL